MSDIPTDAKPNETEGPGADAQAAGATPGSTAPEAPDLAAELNTMRDKWLRAEAEMQNLRNRHKRELEDARNYAVTKFARDVADAAENLRRGLDALPAGGDEAIAKLRGGFEGVERAFIAMLERHGVKAEDPKGKPFDPELHQAMAEQPAPEGVEPGTVVTAWTPAWTINGRLLKPAMVVVAGKG